MDFLKALTLPVDTQTVLDAAKGVLKDQLIRANFEDVNTPEVPILATYESRQVAYKLWWAYFDNHVYEPQEWGGYRSIISDLLGDSAVGGITSFFNPVERAVRAYEYVFDGKFGEDIILDTKVDNGNTINNVTKEAINQTWNWSNINGWKDKFLIKSAALGTCNIRIVFRNDNNGKRILLLPEHPSIVRYVERDDRGNITQLVLEYEKVEGDFFDDGDNQRQQHKYIEYMSREKFWMVKDGEWWNYTLNNGKGEFVDSREEATVPNKLGIVPYVFAMLVDIGGDFGVPCFYGRERQIDHLNALAAHINYQIHKHVVPTWLIEAGGPVPELIQMGDQKIWYVKKDTSITSQVSVKDLVSKMDLNQAITQQTKLQEELTNSMPELKATDGQFLSHQSGGTVAQLRIPAEQRILVARTNLESALVKAQKIAISLGILHGIWDLGTGINSRSAADEAFAQGLEDHRFAKRPALPLTTDDRLTLAKAEQATAASQNPQIPGVQGGDNTAIPKKESVSSTTNG